MPRISVALLCFSSLVLTPLPGATEQDDAIETGWRNLSQMKSAEALSQFSELASQSNPQREARLGEALARLSTAARTAKIRATSRRQLEALSTENPNDETGIAAAYYLARLQQLDEQNPDPKFAIKTYRRLLANHPGHPIAEQAAPKLAILLLYDDVSEKELARRLDEITAIIPTLTHPHSQRDTRLVLAEALLRLTHDHARAYPLLVHCLQHDMIKRPVRLSVILLQAGESARKLGLLPEAARYYAQYVEQFPRDNKTDEIRRRLIALQPIAADD